MRTKQERVHTIGFSIASKLSVQLWVRLIGTFLLLNIFFLGTSAVVLVLSGERSAVEAVRLLAEEGPRIAEEPGLVGLGGVVIERVEEHGIGWSVPEPYSGFFPAETASARRNLVLNAEAGTPFYNLFDRLEYQFQLELDGIYYRIAVQFAPWIWAFKIILLVLLVYQVFHAVQAIFTQARLIRTVLQPISDLAAQAQTLSKEKGPLSVQEMEALAGTLDEINAARLDTRIDLDTTQDELKSVASAINSLLERINQSYRLQARFVSDASHELRTPIAAIQGYVNLLDRWGKNDPEALQESIDAIKEEAANMQELVEQLLFLARGDNQTLQLELEHFDLGALAQTIYNETQMIDSDHKFVVEAGEVWVSADQGLIKQAVRILVDNAIKYTPAGGEIRLRVLRSDKDVHFVVQDSGIGIPAQDIPHIFERFYRADDSRARATGGTGLGLSIAKWIAERHGGHLEVLSREDIGTRFTLVLPATAYFNSSPALGTKNSSAL